MRELTKPLPLSELLSLSLAKVKLTVVDYYRQYASEVITVTTNSGPVKGYRTPSSCDQFRYLNFLGIPYAKPPIGELRFKVRFHFEYLKRFV